MLMFTEVLEELERIRSYEVVRWRTLKEILKDLTMPTPLTDADLDAIERRISPSLSYGDAHDLLMDCGESLIAQAREANRKNAVIERQAAKVERLTGVIAQHDLCHDLHGKVNAEDFAKGCEAEQRRLYGCAPHADEVARLKAKEAIDLKALGAANLRNAELVAAIRLGEAK